MRTVYALRIRGSSNYLYVGQTSNPVKRLSSHSSVFGKNVRMVVLEECEDYRAKTRESHWIRQLFAEGHRLVNMNQLPLSRLHKKAR